MNNHSKFWPWKVSLFLFFGTMEMMQALKVDGKEENDHSALVNYFEKLANFEVKRG